MRFARVAAVAFLVLAGAAVEARADTVALSFTGGSTFTPDGATAGWSFTTASAITVTQLGVWDQGANGLGASHEVGIFTTGGVLLMSATVASGTTDPITAGFRYNSTIAGLTSLAAGSYVVAAYYGAPNDGVTTFADTVNTASGITYTGANFSFNGAFAAPAPNPTPLSFFGPNFQFTTLVATPEPATMGLFALGGLALTGVVVRRRRAAKLPA